MKYFRMIFVFVMLLLLTIGYSYIIRLGAGILDIVLSNANMEPSLSVKWLVQKYPIWILGAWISFVFHLGLTLFEVLKKNNFDAYIKSALCHLLWIVTCFFWHICGFIFPFIIRVYIIE